MSIICLWLPNSCLLPVPKYEIQGVLTNIQWLANGVVLYVIDDGTGLLDCLHFEYDQNTFLICNHSWVSPQQQFLI